VPPERGDVRDCIGRARRPKPASGSFKRTAAIDCDMSEPTVSSETANRRKSTAMSGPLSDSAISHRTLRLASVGGIVRGPEKAQGNGSAASALKPRSESAVTHTGASRVGVPTSPVVALPRGNCPSAVAAGETTRQSTGAVKWKEAKAALAKQAPDRGRRTAATAHLTAPKEQQAGPSAEQMDQGEG
jgi:hypothetical protein